MVFLMYVAIRSCFISSSVASFEVAHVNLISYYGFSNVRSYTVMFYKQCK